MGQVSLEFARVISYQQDDEGNATYDIIQGSSIFRGVPSLVNGGSTEGLSISPLIPNKESIREPSDYEGCVAVLLRPLNGDNPVILGTVLTRKNAKEKLSSKREYDLDGQLNSDKHCIFDETSRLEGSFRSLGAQGITLDTTSNEEPIRLQLSGSSHLRISQTNSLTTDHIVLSSKLMEKLSELETVIAAMAARIDLLTEICADVEIAKAALDNTHIPRITVAAPNMSVWEKGSDASYQADCARISNKSREDSA